jgi:hypothetical protein
MMLNNSQNQPQRSHNMPGSYPDPRSYANDAIQMLKEAYYETPETHAKSLILKAIDAIAQLKEDMKGSSGFDSYEFNESNSAV